ncbi:hypothetical protein [Angustibacter sp. Root456]|uniref:hypothetical protein n=1 Tax=Angustibacter sp. Root456 TaxID=1736539 RepID=UPI000B2D3BA9|nr:hypothetical protein [Angustibacter sp. Root456]
MSQQRAGATPPDRPRRVRVTSPLMGAARRVPHRPATREIDEQTGLGEVYMRSLLRSQLRLALSVLAATAVLIGGLPVLFVVAPSVAQAHLVGLPLPWLLLGALAYPMLWLAARYYVRQAERNEDDFTDVLKRH